MRTVSSVSFIASIISEWISIESSSLSPSTTECNGTLVEDEGVTSDES